MQRRHILSITFLSAVFLLSARDALGSLGVVQVTPGTVGEPAPTMEEVARFEQVRQVLNQSATGSYFLGLREAYKVKVRYEAGQGSSFMQAANRIRLEADLAPLNAALIFAHEMNHAQKFHEGNKAHRKSESRQDYVYQMLCEEAEGMAVSIQVKMELERNGIDVTGITLPLEDDYRQAYQEATDRAGRTTPIISTHQLDVIGKTAGLQALYGAHLRGETSTSNTHETVIDYYGRLWDEVHPVHAFLVNLVGLGTPNRMLASLIMTRDENFCLSK